MRLHTSEIAHESGPAEPAPSRPPRRRSTLQRRLLWTGLIVLLLALAVLAPPLINANRYRRQIAQTMSASLGRPVHLDNVSLHLLPAPGFTLQNFVVSEDPDFGAEPTIRADSVEATLRVSSLWHRPVEFSTVRFVNPSVNLVRNAEGRWNLSEILLHASHVQSAPTDQRRAGPTPRFPYIEATSGRVNVKLGAEKLPFSLTDADFALWLPSPQQWRVRLVGHPARTDTNITDPGTMRMEGELRRADLATGVPVNFSASWHDAPLGEATRILTGDDMGWRGSVNLDVNLAGTLGNAQLTSKLTVGGLRRADFFPSYPLDLQATCHAGFAVHPGTPSNIACALPDDAPQPLRFTADTLSLQNAQPVNAALKGEAIPVRYALLWAALFSARIPTDLRPAGFLNVDLTRASQASPPTPIPTTKGRKRGRPSNLTLPTPPGWTGTVQLTVPPSGDTAPGSTEATPNVLAWHLEPDPASNGGLQLHLNPTQVRLGPNAAVTVSGKVASSGYSVAVTGSAPAAALLVPARYLPQLGDGLEQVIPYPPTGLDPTHVDFTCTRSWNPAAPATQTAGQPATASATQLAAQTGAQAAVQTCTGLQPISSGTPGALRPAGSPAPASSSQSQRPAALLAPRSLSPLDYPPPGTPR